MPRTTMGRTILVALIACASLGLRAQADQPLFQNPTFAEAGQDGSPAAWTRRTANAGYVRTHADAQPSYVEIGVNTAGEDSFIQQSATLPEAAQKVDLRVRFRHFDIVRGEAGHQTGKLHARFTQAGKETGKWIDLGGATGTAAEWAERTRTVDVPEGADGILIRLGMYGVGGGRLEVAEASGRALTAADLERAQAAARPAEPYGEPVPAERLARLRRGVNINNWMCQPYNAKYDGRKGDFTAEHFAAYITDHDLTLLRDAGFDHIRLPIDPVFLMDTETGDLQRDLLPEVDRAIRSIVDAGLAVIVDVHPKSRQFKKMAGTPTAERFVPWWAAFAEHLAATTDPDWVILELLNEPGGQGFWTNNYQPYQDRLITAVRAAAPDHTLIANGGAYMLVKEIDTIDPHPDRNLIYAIHFYEPSPFTHQGALWMKDWYRPLTGLPWPLTPETLDDALAAVDADHPAADKAREVLRDLARSGDGTPEHLYNQMRKVAEWSRAHQRPVVIGEFGVFAAHTPRDARLAYLRDVTAAMAEHGLGWSLWDYVGGGFPIVEDPAAASADRRLDAAVIEALGLAD